MSMVGLTIATVAPVYPAINRATAARSAPWAASPDRWRYTATRLRSASTSRAASARATAAVPGPGSPRLAVASTMSPATVLCLNTKICPGSLDFPFGHAGRAGAYCGELSAGSPGATRCARSWPTAAPPAGASASRPEAAGLPSLADQGRDFAWLFQAGEVAAAVEQGGVRARDGAPVGLALGRP